MTFRSPTRGATERGERRHLSFRGIDLTFDRVLVALTEHIAVVECAASRGRVSGAYP